MSEMDFCVTRHINGAVERLGRFGSRAAAIDAAVAAGATIDRSSPDEPLFYIFDQERQIGCVWIERCAKDGTPIGWAA